MFYDQEHVDRMKAEIERLRQLLDAVFTKWLEDSDPDELPELVSRVREALGE